VKVLQALSSLQVSEIGRWLEGLELQHVRLAVWLQLARLVLDPLKTPMLAQRVGRLLVEDLHGLLQVG
jgi:hypothetical protein